jgi:hypothetical protein
VSWLALQLASKASYQGIGFSHAVFSKAILKLRQSGANSKNAWIRHSCASSWARNHTQNKTVRLKGAP